MRYMLEIVRKSSGKVIFRAEYATYDECLQALRAYDLTKFRAAIYS